MLDEALARANEIKHPVATDAHVDDLQNLLARGKYKTSTLIYLQPISQQVRATQLAVDTCIKNNFVYRYKHTSSLVLNNECNYPLSQNSRLTCYLPSRGINGISFGLTATWKITYADWERIASF